MIEQPLPPPKELDLGAAAGQNDLKDLDALGTAAGRRAKVVAAGHAAADHKTTILVPPQRPKRVGFIEEKIPEDAPAPAEEKRPPRASRLSLSTSPSDAGSVKNRLSISQSPEGLSLTDEKALFTPTHVVSTPSVPRRVPYASPAIRIQSNRHQQVGSASGSVSRPDFDDCLRRSAAVLHKHVTVCDWRRRRAARDRPETLDTGQFRDSAARLFDEARYAAQRKAATIFRLPLAYGAFHVSTRTLAPKYTTPSMRDIYDFMSALFLKAHLSSECSVVCLIYVERLMEKAHVPFDDRTWRPVLLCSMLLASKVWQDCASWNVEFSAVFPQFGLAALNRLERVFVTQIGWDMYISQSLYAKYYFALRSLNEKQDFRRRYNRFVLDDRREPAPKDARIVEQRSTKIRSEWVKALSKSI